MLRLRVIRITILTLLLSAAIVSSRMSHAVAQAGSGYSENIEWSADKRPWEIGVFAQGGFPPSYRIFYGANRMDLYYYETLRLYSAGLELGKETRWKDGPRLLRGRGEALLEIMPFWLARYPQQNQKIYYRGQPIVVISPPTPAANYFGSSATPFLLRWNFSDRKPGRIVPWAQLGGGLLWTNHKFPQGETSVINFTPQVGIGANVFTSHRHSVNFAMKAIHISNATLGDHNPGLNVTLQFSAGYSWWR